MVAQPSNEDFLTCLHQQFWVRHQSFIPNLTPLLPMPLLAALLRWCTKITNTVVVWKQLIWQMGPAFKKVLTSLNSLNFSRFAHRPPTSLSVEDVEELQKKSALRELWKAARQQQAIGCTSLPLLLGLMQHPACTKAQFYMELNLICVV